MDYNYDATLDALTGGALVLALILLLFVLVGAILAIIATWKIFKKAGKKGWYSIVPFYSYWVLAEIAGLNWWWFLLMLCSNIVTTFEVEELTTIASLVSTFASFNCYYNIAKKFGKETGYSVWAGIFSFIFVLIFGLSKKEVYDVNIPVSKNGIFGHPETSNNNYNSNSNLSVTPVSNTNNVEESINNQDFNDQNAQGVAFCGNCGTKMSLDTKFCPNCGKERV